MAHGAGQDVDTLAPFTATEAGTEGPGSGDLVAQQARERARRALFGEAQPVKLGRFTVIERIGSGGMGVVYAAYDPNLDRKVAVKVLHDRTANVLAATARLQREAQFLARVSHPNVVAVHDAGTHRGQVFIAMEFVAGDPVDRWLAAARRTWQEILAVYFEAGRGLAAAHAAQVVHRDFKPGNVLVDRSGRVRVLDFGLARWTSIPETEQATEISEAGAVSGRITLTGSLVGTPAYMAPEQHAGGVVDERSDQFSFCVALWEGLYRQHPFPATTIVELRIRVLDGGPAAPPSEVKVPGRMRAILERGLAVAPEDRFPTMSALLAALETATRRGGWRRWAPAVAFVGVGGLAVGVAALRPRAAPCAGGEEALVGVWDSDRRHDVDAVFVNTGVPMAADAAGEVADALDRYAAAWVDARKGSCEATAVRGEQSPALLDRSMLCLDRRRQKLRATVDRLEEADAELVARGMELVLSLDPVEACRDRERLLADVDPPATDELSDAVVHVRAEIATGESLRLAGRPEAALEQMSDVAERAATIGYPPVHSELQLELARALIGTGKYAEAATHVESAYWTAVDSGHDELARMAALWMGRLAIKLSSDFDGAQAWYRQAEAVVRRTGQDALAMSSVDHFRAMAYEDAAQYDLAREHCERALEPVPPDHPVLMAVLGTCARIASASADQDAAHRYHWRALEAARKTRGEEHPTYAQALVNLTMLEYQQGRLDEASATIEQAIDIFERTVGPSAPQLAVALNNAGVFAEEKGDLERAVELYERGLAIDRATLGEENAEVASRLNNLGGALHRLGRVDDARRTFERTLEIFEKTLGTKHPRVGEALLSLAMVARDEEAWDEALRLDRRALEIWEQALGLEHPHVAFPLLGLCRSLAGDGRAAEAVVHCQRALRIREAHDVGSAALGEARLFTGQALWLEGRDRGHARRLLAEGRAGLATGSPQQLAADQWLHEHGITP